MKKPNSSAAKLLDAFASELQAQLPEGLDGNATVSPSSESEEESGAELVWWSWSLNIDADSRILVGAPLEIWREICGLDEFASQDELRNDELRNEFLARFTPAAEHAARSQFGPEVTFTEAGLSEAPPGEWASVSLTITRESGPDVPVRFTVSPELETALEGLGENPEALPEEDPEHRFTEANSVDILRHVKMSVSVSLGRTRMRMRDLLNLTNGSVVELDQELGEEVDIRVNNCVIAYGEVVAVDGNYAVRILRMAPARSPAGLRGALPERAA